jgi:hypothetical protein
MIELMKNLPSNVVGFRASGEVSKDDYDKVVFPAVEDLVKRTGELNYLYVVDTPFKNFKLGAWWEDAMLSLAKASKRHRAAIVSASEGANTFTDLWGKIFPGEFRGFRPEELDQAKRWVSA